MSGWVIGVVLIVIAAYLAVQCESSNWRHHHKVCYHLSSWSLLLVACVGVVLLILPLLLWVWSMLP